MYELYYWPGFPGRGEFVRLALEAGDIRYRDVAIEAGDEGAAMLVADMKRPRADPPFAPPYLVAEGETIAQTANILLFLGDRHGLAPPGGGRFWANQLQLTIADMVAETHDTHHPVSVSASYEDQMAEAARRAAVFRAERMPKFLGYLEKVLAARGGWLCGAGWAYPDLSLFHLVEGLRFAFPRRMATVERDAPRVTALHDAVAALPGIAAYLASDRRQLFGDGIFRRYPALDGD